MTRAHEFHGHRPDGDLNAYARMDGAWLGSIDVSAKKSKTARFFDMELGPVGEFSKPGGSLYNIEVSNGGLITFPGGVPLANSPGEIIGAIGVSGIQWKAGGRRGGSAALTRSTPPRP